MAIFTFANQSAPAFSLFPQGPFSSLSYCCFAGKSKPVCRGADKVVRRAKRTNPVPPLHFKSEACASYDSTAEADRNKLGNKEEAASEARYHLATAQAISEIDIDEWNFLARQGSACPFLEHDWLRCLEESGAACRESGWLPYHITLRDDSGKLVAAAPTYIKLRDSSGEFVFDSQFAEAAYSIGVQYFPKLLVGIPFTPATGRRLLTYSDDHRDALIQTLGNGILQLCQSMGLQSAHVNFLESDEASALESCGRQWIRRLGVQYHWENKEYESFDDFMRAQFNSKKRIKMNRERSKVRERGIKMRVITGDEILPNDVRSMFRIYAAGIDKQIFWGRQYLNQRFFDLLSECLSFRKHLLFVEAIDENGFVLAGTFNVVSQDVFYGRYWGSPAEIASGEAIPNLHFETCYYTAIDAAIDLGISRIEPGAGGGDSKGPRGFDAKPTFSAHWFANNQLRQAIAVYALQEHVAIESLLTD